MNPVLLQQTASEVLERTMFALEGNLADFEVQEEVAFWRDVSAESVWLVGGVHEAEQLAKALYAQLGRYPTSQELEVADDEGICDCCREYHTPTNRMVMEPLDNQGELMAVEPMCERCEQHFRENPEELEEDLWPTPAEVHGAAAIS